MVGATAPALIRLEQVSKIYQDRGAVVTVLRQVSVEFRRGEIVAILGKSGRGKSTLLNLISGIDLPSEGEIWVEDRPLTRLSERERTLYRRRSVGFVFQFFNLVPTLTVLENTLLPLELNGITGPRAQQAAMAMLSAVEIDNLRERYPDKLSGGEQQRVAIARALVHDPPLVLADEPTGNLDAETGSQVLDVLVRQTRQVGKTLIMVTHSQEVAGLADRVLRVGDGGCLIEERAVLA